MNNNKNKLNSKINWKKIIFSKYTLNVLNLKFKNLIFNLSLSFILNLIFTKFVFDQDCTCYWTEVEYSKQTKLGSYATKRELKGWRGGSKEMNPTVSPNFLVLQKESNGVEFMRWDP